MNIPEGAPGEISGGVPADIQDKFLEPPLKKYMKNFCRTFPVNILERIAIGISEETLEEIQGEMQRGTPEEIYGKKTLGVTRISLIPAGAISGRILGEITGGIVEEILGKISRRIIEGNL